MSRTSIRANDPVDLQIHTIYSDGHWQPEQLFAFLARAGFRVVSITDHDSLDLDGEFAALGARHDIHVIPGIEMTTSWQGLSAHLLCYAQRFMGDALATLARATTRRQEENTQSVYDELIRQGCTFPHQQDVLSESEGRLKRPIDNARLLQAHGY